MGTVPLPHVMFLSLSGTVAAANFVDLPFDLIFTQTQKSPNKSQSRHENDLLE